MPTSPRPFSSSVWLAEVLEVLPGSAVGFGCSRVNGDRSHPAVMGREKERWAELRLSQVLV